VLFKSGEYSVLCFANIYDVAFGACDGVDYVVVQYGEFLRNMPVPDDSQLLKVALVWRGGASNICGEAARNRTSWRSQDILEVPGLSCKLILFYASGVWGCCVVLQFVFVFQFVCVMFCVNVLMRGTMCVCVWLPPLIVSAPDVRGHLREAVGEDHLTQLLQRTLSHSGR
jgi:hypothetical protein